MRYILIIIFSITLSACFRSEKFDASSKSKVSESAQKVAHSLPEEKREEFGKALIYFSVGGSEGFNSMIGAAVLSNDAKTTTETMMAANLQSIHGLTGEEIIQKYRISLDNDLVKQALEARLSEDENHKRKQDTELEQSLEVLNQEGMTLLKKKMFDDALEKYEMMREMSSDSKFSNDIENAISEIKRAKKDFNERSSYLDKIEITEFISTRIDTYTKESVPAVRISLKNNGDRSIDIIKVIVYFQDKDGKIIYEEDFYPVSVSEYSHYGNNKPLKPGYVREMEQNNYYTVKSTLSEWQEGDAFVRVVDVKFSE